MLCEHCGVQNRERASYCRACGKRLERKRENQIQIRQSQPYLPAPRPQQLHYDPLLSRRTVLIGGATLAGALLLLTGCGSSGPGPTPGTSGPGPGPTPSASGPTPTPGDLSPTPTPGTSTSVSSPTSSSPQPQPFQHVAVGTQLVKYQGHDDSVLTVAWSSDSARIASGAGSFDPTVKVWNALNGTTSYTYQHYVSLSVRSLAWSPNGTRIVTGGSGDYADVHAWNATDGGQDTTFELPSTLSIDKMWQVAWSPDGTRFASASFDNTVHVWGAG